jgi:hypothetical protein
MYQFLHHQLTLLVQNFVLLAEADKINDTENYDMWGKLSNQQIKHSAKMIHLVIVHVLRRVYIVEIKARIGEEELAKQTSHQAYHSRVRIIWAQVISAENEMVNVELVCD